MAAPSPSSSAQSESGMTALTAMTVLTTSDGPQEGAGNGQQTTVVIRSNKSTPPQHSPSSTSGFNAPLPITTMHGENFSSDVKVTRCVELKDVPIQFIHENIHLIEHDLQASRIMAQSGDKITILLYVDDIRTAVRIVKDWPNMCPGSQCTYVSAEPIAAMLEGTKVTLAIHAFNGQLDFTAVWTGDVQDASFPKVFEQCHDLAKSYGQVRCFALRKIISSKKASFRVEYYKITSVEDLVKSAGINYANNIASHLNVTVNLYMSPVTEGRSPSSATQVHGNVVNENALSRAGVSPGLNMSETGRTAWQNGRPVCLEGFQDPSVPLPTLTPAHTSTYPYQYPTGITDGYAQGPVPTAPYMHPNQTMSTYSYGNPAFRAMDRASTRPRRNRFSPDSGHHPGQSVDIATIESGGDVRTTLMIRNLPNRVNFYDMKALLEMSSKGHVDFVYVRMDFGTGLNVGYGFINFVRPEYIIPFLRTSVGKPWPGLSSEKFLEVSYATIQGQDCLIQKFRNSSVLREYDGYCPKLLYTDEDVIPAGKHIGDEAPFPAPDNQQKLSRSLDNARTVGLFNTKPGGRGTRESRRPHSQFDRGTPRAIREENVIAAMRTPGRGRGRGFGSPSLSSGHGSSMSGATSDFGPIARPTLPPVGTPYNSAGMPERFYGAGYNPQAALFSPGMSSASSRTYSSTPGSSWRDTSSKYGAARGW